MRDFFLEVNESNVSLHKNKIVYKVNPGPILVSRLNRKGKLVQVIYNDPSAGIVPQNSIGKNLTHFCLELQNYKKCKYHLKKAFANAKKQVFQLNVGIQRYHISLLPEASSNKEVEFVLGIVCDMTKEQKAFEQLVFHEDKLKMIQQVANLGYYEWNIIGNEIFCADQVYRNVGLVPQSISPSPESVLSIIHPEDLAMVKDRLAHPLANRKVSDFEFRAVKPDGSIVWLHTRSYILLDQDGHILGKFGTIQDTTSKKVLEMELKELTTRLNKANNALNASQHNLGMAQKIAKLGYFEWDISNGNLFCSDQQFENFDYMPHELTPTIDLFAKRIHPDDIDVVKTATTEITDKKYVEVEFRVLRIDGSIGWLYARINAITNNQGCLTKILGVTQDITEKKQAESRRNKAERDLIFINQVNTRSHYLNRLLLNDYPLEYTSKALSEFGLESQEVYCCFVMQIADSMGNQTGTTHCEEDTAEIKQQVILWLANKGYDKIWYLNTKIIFLVSITDENICTKQHQLDFSRQLTDEIKEQFPALSINIGISGSSSIPFNIKAVYEKADRAAIVANADNHSQIIHFDDIGLYEIAFQLMKDENIATLADSTIGRLVEYDQTRDGNLLLTLKYILEGESLKAVAQKLYIHPNTAIWRKHRIEELLRMSLDKMDTKVTLLLHLKIWELQHKTNFK